VSIIRGGRPAPAERVPESWIDYRIDWRQIPRWSWRDLSTVVEGRPEELSGRFLIVGSEIEGLGDSSYPLPHPEGLPEDAPGVILQALMVETMLAGHPIRSHGDLVAVLASAMLLPLVLAVLYSRRTAVGVASILVFTASYVGLGSAAFVGWGRLVPLASPMIVFTLAAATAVGVRWQLPERPQRSTGRTR
jgi:CHASE2 domain-containing sensor protein